MKFTTVKLFVSFLLKENVYYKFLMELSCITSIDHSVVLSRGTCGYVEELIKEHLHNFKTLFSTANPISKHHYLLEIPAMICSFGPPVRYSCMRFKAMHKVFKLFVLVLNFQHLCVSLANRYLKYVCQDSDIHSKFHSERIDGPGKKWNHEELARLKEPFDFPIAKFFYSLNWVKYKGTKYIARKCTIAAGAIKDTQLPVYGIICKIFSENLC